MTAGVARAIFDEARANFARAYRILRRRSYWSRVSAELSPLGIDRASLERELSRAEREGTELAGAPDPERVRPLPGLTIARGHAFYEGQWLGRVSPQEEGEWRALETQKAAEAPALLACGFAVWPAPRVRANTWSLVIAPHCDDAALAIGGTMFARRELERPFIADVFTVSGWVGEGLRPRPVRQVTRIRAREEQLSAELLGARSLSLGFWDVDSRTFQRGAEEHYAIPEHFRFVHDPRLRTGEEKRAIREAILAIAKRLRPARIYLPLAIGNHADHQTLRELAFEMLPELETMGELYFYEDQPYSTYERVDAEAIARATMVRGRALVPELVDVTGAFERKIQAITAHRSQFSRAENEGRLRDYARRISRDRTGASLAERLWR